MLWKQSGRYSQFIHLSSLTLFVMFATFVLNFELFCEYHWSHPDRKVLRQLTATIKEKSRLKKETKVEMNFKNWKHWENKGYYKCRWNESFDKEWIKKQLKKEKKIIDEREYFFVFSLSIKDKQKLKTRDLISLLWCLQCLEINKTAFNWGKYKNVCFLMFKATLNLPIKGDKGKCLWVTC